MIEQEETDTEEAKELTEQNKFLAAKQPESQCHLDKEVSMSIDLPITDDYSVRRRRFSTNASRLISDSIALILVTA